MPVYNKRGILLLPKVIVLNPKDGILPQSACAREQKKGKMAVLPIENLSMMRETKIVYKKDFIHMDILQEITRVYHETARSYQ